MGSFELTVEMISETLKIPFFGGKRPLRLYQYTRRHIVESGNSHWQCCENFESSILKHCVLYCVKQH
jgi:hypothetical protein